MSIVTGQTITREFSLRDPITGLPSNASSLPTGTLIKNGVAQGTTVTVANITTGRYTWSVTVPTLALRDSVQVRITCVFAGNTYEQLVYSDVCDIALDSNGSVLLQPTQTGVTIPTVTTLTNAPGDTSGVTTLLSRLTSTRAGLMDLLTFLDASVNSRSTYAGGDTAGTTTLLARLTALRAGYIDNLNPAPPALAAIVQALWAEDLPGTFDPGTAGSIVAAGGGGGGGTSPMGFLTADILSADLTATLLCEN